MKRIDITGQRFGRTVAIKALPYSKWLCRCDCGTEHTTTFERLKRGETQSCGCKRRDKMHAHRSQFKAEDLSGREFGLLTVVKMVPSVARKHARWLCVCDCGTEKTFASGNLKQGSSLSCGCHRRAVKTTHGRTGSTEWKLLAGSKKRAKECGFEHTLTLGDILIPDLCPLLGIPLRPGKETHHDNSPSLDRLDSNLGYTKENVWVISMRANKIKNSASIAEFLTIADNWQLELRRRLGGTEQ